MGIRDKTMSNEHVGCDHLLRAARRCKPKMHCFGHIHEGWGAEKVRWKEGEDRGDKWEEHVEQADRLEADEKKVVEDGAAIVDIAGDGEQKLEFGKETLMVNASIMSVQYKPLQSPWIVDLDLEKAE